MRVERPSESHDLTAFSCGVKALDGWLRVHALENQRRNLSRTFILLDDSEEVAGYYALTMGGVESDELPHRFGRGLPSYQIGLVLLARLAVDGSRRSSCRFSRATCGGAFHSGRPT